MSKLYDLLSAMCGKIKKSDWNQNDPTAPDYVKNRPFWTGFVDLGNVADVEFTPEHIYEEPYIGDDGETYIDYYVTFDPELQLMYDLEDKRVLTYGMYDGVPYEFEDVVYESSVASDSLMFWLDRYGLYISVKETTPRSHNVSICLKEAKHSPIDRAYLTNATALGKYRVVEGQRIREVYPFIRVDKREIDTEDLCSAVVVNDYLYAELPPSKKYVSYGSRIKINAKDVGETTSYSSVTVPEGGNNPIYVFLISIDDSVEYPFVVALREERLNGHFVTEDGSIYVLTGTMNETVDGNSTASVTIKRVL